MVTEIALLTINPAQAADFEAAVAKAAPHFRVAKGCTGMALERVIENPSQYRLVVQWETLENHTRDFRESEDFKAWRALAGPFFAAPPTVDHSQNVARYF